ncbi:UDP-glucose 4-epimerase GalE [bacterium]|jgi:UDP-glucose 4-epimerase|nr:UDP-glucose 4-epimerase GalE [bacterium]
MRPTVLVTGGAGYIGSHSAYLLTQRGYNVVIIDNLCQGQEWSASWAPLVKSDIEDLTILEETFKHYNPVAVMHFAAFIEVGHSVQDPARFYHNNVSKTISLLQTMLKHNVNKFIFSSSCATYGKPQRLPLVETHQKNPVSPYGRTKMIIEMALEDFNRAYGLEHVSLRYFNAAGALPEHGLGERHNPESHIIPLLLRAAENGNTFKIFGDDYPTPDGTCIRDYLHVLDIADAHCKALEYLLSGQKSDAFNLGSGQGHSVQEMIKEVELVTQAKIQTTSIKRREGDPPVLIADNSKAADVLGWVPQYSDIQNILQSAYEFECSNDTFVANARNQNKQAEN